MTLKINKDLIDYIKSSNYDENIKNFLIQALMLEFKREKENSRNYTDKYDEIINNYID
ncbi:hypothetical protein [Methanobrevibacter wolinii]|uniref:hypothetical protein n=1 Tax=Methanobrevibacter wolinii TaxID=190977 RepID=UPI000A7B476C|nr:hypothetical protein [Methanobrevibacter wolinii]